MSIKVKTILFFKSTIYIIEAFKRSYSPALSKHIPDYFDVNNGICLPQIVDKTDK
jgi:hypothetical protein